jgi:rubrerythrin
MGGKMSTKQFDTYPEQPDGEWVCSNPRCGQAFSDPHSGKCPMCAKEGMNWSLYKRNKKTPALKLNNQEIA